MSEGILTFLYTTEIIDRKYVNYKEYVQISVLWEVIEKSLKIHNLKKLEIQYFDMYLWSSYYNLIILIKS